MTASTGFGVGYANDVDGRRAAAQATRAALAKVNSAEVRLVLLFGTSRHDPEMLTAGVRDVVGAGPVVFGGYGAGIITRETFSYGGGEVGVAVMASRTVKVETFRADGLADAEYAAGRTLAAKLEAAEAAHERQLLLMYDAIDRTPPPSPKFNMATPLIAGLTENLAQVPPLAGMGCMGDFECKPSAIWDAEGVARKAASLLALSGPGLRLETTILHGCVPIGDYHTVTKAEGPVVLEIDGKPALDAVRELLGPDSPITPDRYPFFLTLGVNEGDRYAPFREDAYASRLCMAIDEVRRGLVMFEPDLVEGSVVQLMRRRIDFDYVGDSVRALVAGAENPLLALYIDCMGRAASMTGWEDEDARYVQASLDPAIPLLGVYSGVEIARTNGRLRALDWTGVLCLLSERA